MVEMALGEGVLGTDDSGALTADIAVPTKEKLALRVIYYEATPESAYAVTLYPVGRKRSNL